MFDDFMTQVQCDEFSYEEINVSEIYEEEK
jgi:hypothetical protein